MAPGEEYFQFGYIAGVHGIRGVVRVRPLTAGSDALCDAQEIVLVSPDGGERSFRPGPMRSAKGDVLLGVPGVDTPEKGQLLRGSKVYMKVAELAEPDEDEHYWHQLEGIRVVDHLMGDIGTLTEILSTGAHDIYQVEGLYGEILIPAVKEIVRSIDLETQIMKVELPPGMIDEIDED